LGGKLAFDGDLQYIIKKKRRVVESIGKKSGTKNKMCEIHIRDNFVLPLNY